MTSSSPLPPVSSGTPAAQPQPWSQLENKTFFLLLAGVTLAFGWILWPFYGAVFWGVVMAILFAPLFRWLLKPLKQRRTLAALCTLLVILVIVILPMSLIAAMLVKEGNGLYLRMQSGELNFGAYFGKIVAALPHWVSNLLDRFGLGNLGDLQEKLSSVLAEASQTLATQAFSIGQNTLDFVVSFFIMLYLMFFLLRDGASLLRRMRDAIPLDSETKRQLFGKFTTVVRATVKGNVLVAVVQGLLGGLAFWFLGIHAAVLWAVLMAFLSLLPAVGAGLIWLPVAIYFLVTGAVWQGVALVAYGVLVIGLVDNVLRPVLVGKDIKMPDYLVLISTLGGMAIFGLNGFVIGPVIAAMFMAVWDIFAGKLAVTAAAKSALPPRQP
ncbi:Predicted PurR-regulated permease PerM [Rhodoferax sp. OV413]|uniref:AI-2E family transporter n=1 Tax=Rhodoferax sp. OV413 TaxID=1855285 RepID=UPI00088B9B64|nr:AI-2E family transporter [Rhodoferax sp. OV413]SDO67613.1 Predicted PurR-regulated permease PerM [Rhodoferax sp. OV413]